MAEPSHRSDAGETWEHEVDREVAAAAGHVRRAMELCRENDFEGTARGLGITAVALDEFVDGWR